MRYTLTLLLCLLAIQAFGNFRVEYLQVNDLKSNELVNNSLTQWQIDSSGSLNFGFLTGEIWLRFNVDASKRLELKNPNLDYISLYRLDNDSLYLLHRTGDVLPLPNKPIDHRYYQFDLQAGSYYILIKNFGDQLFIPYSFKNSTWYKGRDNLEYVIYGIYFGICLFAFIFNIFLVRKLKDRSNGWYASYIAALVLLQLTLSGFGSTYLWETSNYIINHGPPFFASIAVLFLIYFTQHFLNTAIYLKKWHQLFNWISYLLLLNAILSFLPITYSISILIVNGLTLILNIIILPVAILILRQGFKPARFFFFAFVVLILSVFLFVLRNFGLIGNSFLTENSLLIGSSIEILLLTFAIVDRFKQYKDEAVDRLEEVNQLQLTQNLRLEEEVRLRTAEISTTNKELLDSINYAKRIQNALIPAMADFNNHFEDSFVYWKPKDIVSGDFYWASNVQTTHDTFDNHHLIVFAVGDCTGHGVPGAILSVLGLKILNLSLKNKDVNTTSEALNYLNKQFNITFSSNRNNNSIQDGMDIVLCALDKKNKKLYFSGAKNNLILIRKGKIIKYRGDRSSISPDTTEHQFNQHSIDVEKDDVLYLSTDGLQDQFGGSNGKKLKSKPLFEFILSINQLSMDEQRNLIKEKFHKWKGDYPQTDDVCIVGIRI